MRKELMVLLLIVTLAVGMIGAANAEPATILDHGHGPGGHGPDGHGPGWHPGGHGPGHFPFHPPFYPPWIWPWWC